MRSPKKDWISAILACELWDVAPSCWKYPTESSSSSNWFTKVLKISIYAAVLMVSSKKMGPIMRCRDIPHQTPIFSEWRGSSCTAFGFSLAQISHTTNVLLFKFRWNIFIGVRIIKEMPGSVLSGTHCIYYCHDSWDHNVYFCTCDFLWNLHFYPPCHFTWYHPSCFSGFGSVYNLYISIVQGFDK